MLLRNFEEVVVPHLDAAFNYARWLTKSDADAEDVVQDACVRALRFFSGLKKDDARAWLMAIVRNTWYSSVSRRAEAVSDGGAAADETHDSAPTPEAHVIE